MKNDLMKEEVKVKKEKQLIALKDFKCFFNGKVFEVKKGEVVVSPKGLLQNLKTEKVI